jgi:ureidoacrylate peracid hydrolase
MSEPALRPHIIARVMARRGRLHWFDKLDPKTSALIVIDMQDTFCAPGAPAEVPGAREIIAPINAFAKEFRALGGQVVWVLHANDCAGEGKSLRSDWELFFNHVVADDVRTRTIESLAPGRQKVWAGLEQDARDLTIFKNRYSALISGSSGLERAMRSMGIDTLLIAGTKTNVCCESTARDAMMLDFKTIMLEDCCAALSFEEHRASLETFIQQFGDVLTGFEALKLLKA